MSQGLRVAYWWGAVARAVGYPVADPPDVDLNGQSSNGDEGAKDLDRNVLLILWIGLPIEMFSESVSIYRHFYKDMSTMEGFALVLNSSNEIKSIKNLESFFFNSMNSSFNMDGLSNP